MIYLVKNPQDTVVLSAGHLAMALYVVLEKNGKGDAEEMYKKTAAQGGADGGAQGMGGDSGSGSASSGGEGMKNAEDVDYEVVDDDKK